MKKTIFSSAIACLLGFAYPALGQEQQPNNDQQFYWVAFKDKAKTPYTVDAPDRKSVV